jgi:hypothetical protein
MGLPEPIEPQPDDAAPKPPGDDRADWLCGAEEGLEAEMLRTAKRDAAPAPKLHRPGADASQEADEADSARRRESSAAPGPRLFQPSAPEEPSQARAGLPLPKRAPGAVQADETSSGFSTGPSMLWEPGANSTPVLARTAAPAPAPAARTQVPQPAPEMDFPMDDAEERARARAEATAAASGPAVQPHAVVTPDAFDIKDAPAPWWMQLPQILSEDRRVQGLVAVVLVGLLAVMFWPRAEKTMSLGGISRDPAHYDGQSVKVSGRIGETFEVGGGHAFYLHQGRDTLVVFTRSRTPRRGQNVTLVGTVSTGYLNGQSGTAIFEAAQP